MPSSGLKAGAQNNICSAFSWRSLLHFQECVYTFSYNPEWISARTNSVPLIPSIFGTSSKKPCSPLKTCHSLKILFEWHHWWDAQTCWRYPWKIVWRKCEYSLHRKRSLWSFCLCSSRAGTSGYRISAWNRVEAEYISGVLLYALLSLTWCPLCFP